MDKMRIQMSAVDAVKASAKALKAIYHDSDDDTVKGYLVEASAAINNALEEAFDGKEFDGKEEIPGDVKVDLIPVDEINHDKIVAISVSISNGKTTIDDWVLCDNERNSVSDYLADNFGKDLWGDDLPNEDTDDAIVDTTTEGGYNDDDKVMLKKVIDAGSILRKAARSVNRHIDNGDFNANREKLHKVNSKLIDWLENCALPYFNDRGRAKAAYFANHLAERAKELRDIRLGHEYKTRANIVKRFETKVEFDN